MDDQARRGTLYGAAAYALWGLFPLFWPLLVVAALLQASRTWARVRVTRTQFLRLSLASVLLAVITGAPTSTAWTAARWSRPRWAIS